MWFYKRLGYSADCSLTTEYFWKATIISTFFTAFISHLYLLRLHFKTSWANTVCSFRLYNTQWTRQEHILPCLLLNSWESQIYSMFHIIMSEPMFFLLLQTESLQQTDSESKPSAWAPHQNVISNFKTVIILTVTYICLVIFLWIKVRF